MLLQEEMSGKIAENRLLGMMVSRSHVSSRLSIPDWWLLLTAPSTHHPHLYPSLIFIIKALNPTPSLPTSSISTIHLHISTIRDSCQPQRPWWNQVPSGRARPRPLHRKYPGHSPRWKCLWIYRPWPAGIGRRCEQVENRVENANARTTLTFLDCLYVSRLIPKLQDWSRNIFWNSFHMNTLIK